MGEASVINEVKIEDLTKPSAELLEEHEKELAEEREKAEKAEVEAMMDRLPPWF